MRLCPACASPAEGIPQAKIDISLTGREALDKLGMGADFALATEDAFEYLTKQRRAEIVKIADIIHHSVSSRVYFKSGRPKAQARAIATNLEQGTAGSIVVLSETNYYRIASRNAKNWPFCKIYSVPYDNSEVNNAYIKSILQRDGEYIIFLGLQQWLDAVDDKLHSIDGFRHKYPSSHLFNSGFGLENYSLFAFFAAVRGDEANNLDALRSIVIYLNQFAHFDLEKLASNVVDVHSCLNDYVRDKLYSASHVGDLERHLVEIQLAIRPMLTAHVAEIWKDEVHNLKKDK